MYHCNINHVCISFLCVHVYLCSWWSNAASPNTTSCYLSPFSGGLISGVLAIPKLHPRPEHMDSLCNPFHRLIHRHQHPPQL